MRFNLQLALFLGRSNIGVSLSSLRCWVTNASKLSVLSAHYHSLPSKPSSLKANVLAELLPKAFTETLGL